MNDETAMPKPLTDAQLNTMGERSEYDSIDGSAYGAIKVLTVEVGRLRDERAAMLDVIEAAGEALNHSVYHKDLRLILHMRDEAELRATLDRFYELPGGDR